MSSQTTTDSLNGSDAEKEAGHTPGPWETDDYDQYDKHICIRGNGQYLGEMTTDNLGFNEGEANAHLVAAAPDLLEACKALDEAVDQHGQANLTKLFAAVKLARLALARVSERTNK
jgi:hypothetical protein